QRLPSVFWKPVIRATDGFRVCFAALHAIHSTAGGRGGWRFHEPCTATTAPPDHGAGILLPSRKARPSGALCAGSPTWSFGSLAQSRWRPPGLVSASATNGTLASEPAGWFRSWSGLQYGQPRSGSWVTGRTSSGGWLFT